jgi:hypothetical protein
MSMSRIVTKVHVHRPWFCIVFVNVNSWLVRFIESPAYNDDE